MYCSISISPALSSSCSDAPHLFEARQQVIGPQAPFLGALTIVDDLATMHH